MESSNFYTSSIRDEWYGWKSGKKSKRRNFSSIVTLRIGWKMVGWFYGKLLLFAQMSKTSWQTGKLPMKDDSENLSRNQSFFFFGAMVEYHSISVRDQSRLHQLGKNVLFEIFLGYELIDRGVNLERRRSDCGIWKNWTIWTHQKLILNESNRKKKWSLQREKKFMFPKAVGTAKLFGRDSAFREPSPRRKPTVRSEDLSEELQGESEEPQPAESKKMTLKPEGIFVYSRWLHFSSSHWTTSSTLCAERRNVLLSTDIHWYYKVYSRWSGRHARKAHW